jgi:hypothetical protein
MLDDLGHCIDARGFGDSFHEGIVSLMILTENPHCPLYPLFVEFKIHLECSEYPLE